MAALSADIPNVTDRFRSGQTPMAVANGTAVFAGGLVGVNSSGFIVPWANTAGLRFAGRVVEGVTGDTSLDPDRVAIIDDSGSELPNAVVASAVQGSVYALVYSSTDNPADFTLSATANVKAVGMVTRFRSAGIADVRLFTPTEHAALN